MNVCWVWNRLLLCNSSPDAPFTHSSIVWCCLFANDNAVKEQPFARKFHNLIVNFRFSFKIGWNILNIMQILELIWFDEPQHVVQPWTYVSMKCDADAHDISNWIWSGKCFIRLHSRWWKPIACIPVNWNLELQTIAHIKWTRKMFKVNCKWTCYWVCNK